MKLKIYLKYRYVVLIKSLTGMSRHIKASRNRGFGDAKSSNYEK